MTHAHGAQPTSRAAAPAGRFAQVKSVALYVVQGLLAVFFVRMGALPALLAEPGAKGTFEDIGFGLWFMYLTGALELLGAIALLTPWLSGPAALGLMGVMA
ncbi:MAG: DoxX family protein, partial [Streptomyces sp.]|uniref:DoxX family protein n=1 Tax=Streptomyces sp. TaxID=1931 RepID=UPI003D6C5E74